MAEQLWSWALTLVGVVCFFLAGKKIWWAWYVGLAGQVTWFAYSVSDLENRAGFLVGVALYTFVYSKNARDWTRERFPKRAPNGMLLSSRREPPTVGPKGPSATINVRPRTQQPVARRIEPQVRATPPRPPQGGSGISRPRG